MPNSLTSTENHKLLKEKKENHFYHIQNENIFSSIASVSDNNWFTTECSNSAMSSIKYDFKIKDSDSTIVYEVDQDSTAVCFGLDVSETINNVISVGENKLKCNDTLLDCQILNNSSLFECDKDLKEESFDFDSSNQKEVIINVEDKLSTNNIKEKSEVLILNSNAIAKLNYVNVQSPNYKLVKRKFPDNSKLKNRAKRKAFDSDATNRSCVSLNPLKQIKLDCFLKPVSLNCHANKFAVDTGLLQGNVDRNGVVMSKKPGVANAIKLDRVQRPFRSVSNNETPRSANISPKKNTTEIAALQQARNHHSANSHSPRKNSDSLQLILPSRCQSKKTPTWVVPHHKIVAGNVLV